MGGYKITAIIKNIAGVSVRAETEEGERLEFLITEDSFRELGLEEGAILSEEEFSVLETEADFCRAAARAVKILSYSSHSKAALVRKLRGFGFDGEVAVRAADAVTEKGLLDELHQAEHLTDYYLRHKYWGKKRIAAELMSRGYGKDAIVGALSQVDEDRFAENLARLVAKKPVPEEKQARDKYVSALVRMGYTLPEILRAIKDDKDNG